MSFYFKLWWFGFRSGQVEMTLEVLACGGNYLSFSDVRLSRWIVSRCAHTQHPPFFFPKEKQTNLHLKLCCSIAMWPHSPITNEKCGVMKLLPPPVTVNLKNQLCVFTSCSRCVNQL